MYYHPKGCAAGTWPPRSWGPNKMKIQLIFNRRTAIFDPMACFNMCRISKTKPTGMDQDDYHRRVRRVYVHRKASVSITTFYPPRRADFRVLPLLLIGFASYQLDRTNISSALTAGFAAAIGVDQNTINLGNQLMFLGVIVLEIPSNILLHSVQKPIHGLDL